MSERAQARVVEGIKAVLQFKPKEIGVQPENYDLDGVSPLLKKLLAQRGVTTRAQAEAFLNPARAQLHDPLLMQNMAQICTRISAALSEHEPICVYGDYDVDGVTSAAILSMYLRSQGGDVSVYIPSRHEEGYGLNLTALEQITRDRSLIISVDCGITSQREVAYVKGLGRDIIVTDHHQLPPVLPECLCLDPLMGDYPFRRLCGAGVVMKLLQALGGMDALEPYWDLAALGTIADIVPLVDENRVLASLGLKRMNERLRPGLRALCRVAGLKCDQHGNYRVTSGNVAFQLAPRINAGGRMESAVQCVELLTSDDGRLVEELAERLGEDNAQRQAQEQQMIQAAEASLADADFTSFRAIIVCGEGWNPGVVGLAASRLTEKYHYPSIVLTRRGDLCVGSCRSIKGVDIFAALSSCKDLFTRFGGHPQAAGLTIHADDLPKLIERLNDYLRRNVPSRVYLPELEYDCELEPAQLTLDTARELELLAPTGFGNPAPLFRMQAQFRSAAAVGQGGAHLKAVLGVGNVQIGAIGFRMGAQAAQLQGRKRDIVFSLGINSYMGTERPQAELKALDSISPNDEIAELSETAKRDYISYLDSLLYNINIDNYTPQRLPLEQLADMLRNDAQGMVLAADTPAALKRTLIALSGMGVIELPDVCRGFPEERRAFNALCLCPIGLPPRGYGRYVSVGGWLDGSYARALADAGVDVYRLDGAPGAPALRASDDELRQVYRFVSANRLALAGMSDLCGLSEAVAGGARVTPGQALVALHIFRELKLVELDRQTHVLQVLPMHKVELSSSLIYRRLGELAQGV